MNFLDVTYFLLCFINNSNILECLKSFLKDCPKNELQKNLKKPKIGHLINIK